MKPMPWIAAIALCAATALPAAERSIDKEVVVAASLDDAWAAWTTREGITSFFAPDAVIDARPGGAFHIHIDPTAPPGQKGADDMRYLAVQPKQMLSFDWNAPPHLPAVRAQRSFVVLRFEPLDAQRTRVSLHHTGWGNGGEWDQAHAYFDQAWGKVLGNLKTRFESGPIDWTAWLAQLRQWREQADKKR